MLSILGFYNYDHSIFQEMQLPVGINPDLVQSSILMECAELEIIYSNFDVMKAAIGYWSRKELPIWQHLKETTEYKYNPIWNKDGIITETETRDLTKTDTHSGNDKTTTTTDQTREAEKTNNDYTDVSAYDASSYVNRDYIHGKETNDAGAMKEVSDLAHGLKVTGKDTGTVTNTREEHGNIGVTTTQQMIKEEREIATFNIIDYIVESFKKRFCILVY